MRDMERIQKGFDSLFMEAIRRFEDGNPMRFLAIRQFMDLEDQMHSASTDEAWDQFVENFKEKMMMTLNNMFDSLGGENIDNWLEQNGFR
tara:strand:+ start:986 stop:1255 length:270 start_codon:yes stop_codon:yes gene_type:complete